MIGSVRARLTTTVVLVVGALAAVAALLAPQLVESALVDDRLDAETAAEAAALRTTVTVVDVDGRPLDGPELTAVFGPELVELTSVLDDRGALDELRSFRDDRAIIVVPVVGVVGTVDADGAIRVTEGEPTDVEAGPVVTADRLGRLAADLGARTGYDPLDDLLTGDASIDDFIAQLESRFGDEFGDLPLDLGPVVDFGTLADQLFSDEFLERQRELIEGTPGTERFAPARSIDQMVFGVRQVDGVDVIVAAPADGIALSVERVQTALWITVPIAMLVTGLLAWLLAGRALRPVRAISEQTEQIGAGTLHERVPVPKSGDEVAGLARVMNDMLDRIQREDRRRRQFVADASHELRSPISSIQTQAEVAASEGGAAAELADGVLAEAERLGALVDDLLALARHDEALAPPGGVVDLDDIVLAEADRPRRVPIDTSRVSGGQVRGRPDELGRVVTHLLDNAARHAESEVHVSLATEGGAVVLEVHDDGPGVPPPERARVFERFVRLDEARERDGGGAGLGLAVVATVVRAAGGSVAVDESSDLGGAAFRITLPPAN